MASRRGKRKRKRSHTQPLTTSHTRFVYIIARQLQAARHLPISFSDGKFPVCHWGVFVSDSSEEEIRWRKCLETTDASYLPPRGTMLELWRYPDNTNTYDLHSNFGLCEWYTLWGGAAIRYVGETEASDASLETRACEIVKSYPNYSAFSNSCQNFVLYLLEFACPDFDITIPKTFVDAVTGPIWDWNGSRTRKRTGTKSNDSIQDRNEEDHHRKALFVLWRPYETSAIVGNAIVLVVLF